MWAQYARNLHPFYGTNREHVSCWHHAQRTTSVPLGTPKVQRPTSMSPHPAVQVYARCFRKEHRHSSCRITLTHHAMVQTLVGASVCARTRKGCRFRSSALFVVFANGKMDRYPILGYCAGYCTGFRDVRCKFTATDTDTDILRSACPCPYPFPDHVFKKRIRIRTFRFGVSVRRTRTRTF